MAECPLCIEAVPDATAVVCPACQYRTCRACTKRYLLDALERAHCMNCKARWGLQFLVDAFGVTWATGARKTDYRAHLKRVVVERERSQIPDTLARLPEIAAKKQATLDARRALHETKLQISALRQKAAAIKQAIREQRTGGKKATHYVFVCPCPVDGCRGMVEATSHKCAVCKCPVCRTCRASLAPDRDAGDQDADEKGEQDADEKARESHVCSEDDLKTVRLLKRDTKPCPRCAVPIHRYAGCNQMWCTACHTGYDWQTGAEIFRNFHNPHALAWQRRGGARRRQPGNVPCGDLPELHKYGLSGAQYRRVQHIYRGVAEACDNLLNAGFAPKTFDELRMQYVTNKITEEQWRRRVFALERENERTLVMRDVLTTFRDLGVERLRDLFETLHELNDARDRAVADADVGRDDKEWEHAPWDEIENRLANKTAAKEAHKKNTTTAVAAFTIEMEKIRSLANEAFGELCLLGKKVAPEIGRGWSVPRLNETPRRARWRQRRRRY